MAEPNLKFAFGLKPKEAVEFFRRKGFNLTWDWEDQVGETHNIAFTVAKVLVLDVLQTIKDAVAKALSEGQSEESFRRDLEPMLKQKGWWGRQTEIVNGEEQQAQLGSPRRLKTIFRTNLQSAMMAGRQQQFEQNTDARPYWQYVAVLDSRTRPMHRKLHDAIYRFDDPFWEYYRPPISYNCRCRLRALSARNVEQRGLTVESSEGRLGTRKQLLSRRSGIEVDAPVLDGEISPDPGFAYSKRQPWAPDLSKYDPELAAQYRKAVEEKRDVFANYPGRN
jgi:SPP1 gp7 family putative phage head morphogenesis protein